MAKVHEKLVLATILEWSKTSRGRLWAMKQGKAIPLGACLRCDGQTRPAPLDFGTVKGFSDIFGIEFTEPRPVPAFIEVKTGRDWLRPEQRKFLEAMHKFGCNCYIVDEKGIRAYPCRKR